MCTAIIRIPLARGCTVHDRNVGVSRAGDCNTTLAVEQECSASFTAHSDREVSRFRDLQSSYNLSERHRSPLKGRLPEGWEGIGG